MSRVTDWNIYTRNHPRHFWNRCFFLQPLFRSYLKLLQDIIPQSIIELGCGTGYISYLLAKKYHPDSLFLVDSNRSMLNIAAEVTQNISCPKKLLLKNFLSLKLHSHFDLVHSAGVIEHFSGSEQKQLIQLHADLLKPHGYCLIFVPTPTFSYRFIRKLCEIFRIWPYPDETPLKLEQLTPMLQKAGLTVIRHTYFWRHFWLSELGVLATISK
jgi:cyclopropane fatty-acyl-phospholipid synthase-like methyltransferase